MLQKNFFFTIILVAISLVASLGLTELFLRLKNANMQNYNIEMWRYSKELKRESSNGLLGHEHIPSSSAILQSVSIRINSDGLRGEEINEKELNEKRIIFLGSSVTFPMAMFSLSSPFVGRSTSFIMWSKYFGIKMFFLKFGNKCLRKVNVTIFIFVSGNKVLRL